ncbi:phenylalanine--tRNA ligase subunit beta [candidate division KSB1 bacterium]|nr:phenylalanine--tRNA ligase subunit beta [candidate division KSB1 bacterium]
MKISLNWLKTFLTLDFKPADLANRLTMIGFEVEDVIDGKTIPEGIVVGKVVRAEKHPNADKLTICDVALGTEKLQIVCGAPNVAEGQLVPIATVGTRLSEDFEIKPVKLRGFESNGMICSERELGLSDAHDGIMVLDPAEYQSGQSFKPSIQSDTVFDLSITPNRPDCLSHIGIARELGILTDQVITLPDATLTEDEQPANKFCTIEIHDPEACPRYSARVIRNVKIAPSPKWLQDRLDAVGIRAINNVVDITNLILMETGHPLHAFDYDQLAGQKIIVRKAQKGEKFTTLDGQSHTLTADDLLIADSEKGIALAGIMGGENSEVSDQTRNILLESAYFAPMTIRKTAKRLELSTEASQRFERGCDPNGTLFALNRAVKLFAKVAEGEIAKGIIDVYPKSIVPWTVSMRSARIERVLGVSVPTDDVIKILAGLGLQTEGKDPISVIVPTYRPDLKEEIDLIEEVVRHYGYDNIEPQFEAKNTLDAYIERDLELVESIRDYFSGTGFSEVLTTSMVPESAVKIIQDKREPLSVQNPLSPDTAFMRSSLISGLLDSVKWNCNRSQSNLRLFEIGQIFIKQNQPLPDEKQVVSGALTGQSRPRPHWKKDETAVDFFQLKGTLESFANRFRLGGFDMISKQLFLFNPSASIELILNNEHIGWMGELNDSILKSWDIEDPVYAFELEITPLFRAYKPIQKYRPISKYPSVKRDLAIVVDERVYVGDIKNRIQKSGTNILTQIDFFDQYQGEQVEDGKKSVAVSLTFTSHENTLSDSVIDPVIGSIVQSLESEMSATLRT